MRLLRLAANLQTSCLSLPNTGITSVHHHARLVNIYLLRRIEKFKGSRAWWRTLVIPVLGRLRQEDCRFVASLSYLVRPSAT